MHFAACHAAAAPLPPPPPTGRPENPAATIVLIAPRPQHDSQHDRGIVAASPMSSLDPRAVEIRHQVRGSALVDQAKASLNGLLALGAKQSVRQLRPGSLCLSLSVARLDGPIPYRLVRHPMSPVPSSAAWSRFDSGVRGAQDYGPPDPGLSTTQSASHSIDRSPPAAGASRPNHAGQSLTLSWSLGSSNESPAYTCPGPPPVLSVGQRSRHLVYIHITPPTSANATRIILPSSDFDHSSFLYLIPPSQHHTLASPFSSSTTIATSIRPHILAVYSTHDHSANCLRLSVHQRRITTVEAAAEGRVFLPTIDSSMISPYDPSHPARPVLARRRTSDKGLSEHSTAEAHSPSDSQDGKSRTRARINMACIHCRHRKIKCDGAQPSCATCVRLRRECEYEPVTEFENLMSRERKRRNKEKKAARMASLGIFAGQSPLSMLHPGASLGLPPAPMAHYGDPSQANLAPLFLSMPDPHMEGQMIASQFGPRRRRGISDTQATTMQHRVGPLTSPVPDSASFQHASVSQPPTPAQAYRYYQALALPQAQHAMMQGVPAEFISGPLSAPIMPPAAAGHFFVQHPMTPGHAAPQHGTVASPHVVDLMGLNSDGSAPHVPSGRASATEADFDLGLVDLTGMPTMVPTSAHVRPVDLPAPHGHFDFASVPFPTQDTFASELPFTALRRRSSIHLPVGTADAFRRPSIAEVATAALMQKVAGKRAEKVNTDIKQLASELMSPDATGIVAWNAHVQSQMPASMATWSGFNTGEIGQSEGSDYVPLAGSASRSNSDGLLSLGPLSPPTRLVGSGLVKAERLGEERSAASSCSVTSSTGDSSVPAEVPLLEHSYFAAPQGKLSREISPLALSPSGSSQPSSLLSQDAWNVPLLSPVSELNTTFNTFSVFAANASGQHLPTSNNKQETHDNGSLSMAFMSNANASMHNSNF